MGRFDEIHRPCVNADQGEEHDTHREFYGVTEYVCPGYRAVSAESVYAAMEYMDAYVTTPTTNAMMQEEIDLWMEGIEEEDAAWRDTFSPAGWILIAACLFAGIVLGGTALWAAVNF